MTSLLEDMTIARVRWVSEPLRSWYPAPMLARQIREEMTQQAQWVGDLGFGQAFRDNMATGSVADPQAWANRRIDLPDDHWCVTGIRFRGLDINRPFVEIVATSLPPDADALAALCDGVLPYYEGFAPRALRVDAPDPDALVRQVHSQPRFSHAAVDQYVVAAQVADLLRRPFSTGFDRITLSPIDAADATPAVARYYAQAQAQNSESRQWARPSDQDELQECADAGLLFRADVDGRAAGVLGSHREEEHGMTGFVIQEIVLNDEYRGRRLAAPAMQHLIRRLVGTKGDTLWGTIHPANHPSLRNARSVGRRVVGGYVWLTPTELPGL